MHSVFFCRLGSINRNCLSRYRSLRRFGSARWATETAKIMSCLWSTCSPNVKEFCRRKYYRYCCTNHSSWWDQELLKIVTCITIWSKTRPNLLKELAHSDSDGRLEPSRECSWIPPQKSYYFHSNFFSLMEVRANIPNKSFLSAIWKTT